MEWKRSRLPWFTVKLDLTFCTGDISVSLEGRVACAILFVVPGLAGSSQCARIFHTQWDTLLLAPITALSVPAVSIQPTLYLEAFHVRVPLQAGSADTLGSVEVDLALCICTTRSGKARVNTLL